MKTKNKLIITAMALIAIITMTLIFIGCEEEPQEHESTINAFGRDIIVKGDASISAGDFNNAKIKLQTAMKDLETVYPSGNIMRPKFDNMLDRPGFVIMIKTGNAGPAADANKSMTIGVRYLIDNDVKPTIVTSIAQKVNRGAFAD
jgi:uncharacterized lipoprotein NlpE involved in copper resistance